MTLTKAKLTNLIQNRTGYSKRRSSNLLDSLFHIIKTGLQSREEVLISGFGKFSVVDNQKRRRGTTHARENVMPESERSVTFKCSPVWRDKINKRR